MKILVRPAALLFLTFLTACTAGPAATQEPPGQVTETAAEITPQDYVVQALDFIAVHGLFVQDIDWDAVRADAIARTAGAASPEQTYGTLEDVLAQAGGEHSGLRAPAPNLGFSYIATPEASIPADGVVVVELPGFRSPRAGHVDEYAAAGNELFEAFTDDARCGWILDLRRNGGGNMMPMLGALAPLLPEGPLMQFVDRDGNTSAATLRRNGVYFDDERMAPAGHAGTEVQRPVAILQSAGTASSAEAVIIAFRSRDGVRLFGGETAGLATGNVTKSMPDGAVLRVTQSRMAAADGEIQWGPVPPDVAVEGDPLEAAAKWLQDECSVPE